MKVLVTGSSGHLGEALVRTLRDTPHQVVGLDLAASPFTDAVGSVIDRVIVRRCVRGVDAVIHAATLHKPHVATHPRQAFIDTNVTGTLNLLEEAARFSPGGTRRAGTRPARPASASGPASGWRWSPTSRPPARPQPPPVARSRGRRPAGAAGGAGTAAIRRAARPSPACRSRS
jgi:nucleoside-diphosphate-sugar epimerase